VKQFLKLIKPLYVSAHISLIRRQATLRRKYSTSMNANVVLKQVVLKSK
jgi:hypothetical protein